MTLEQAIHQRWSADAALCALLPAERLTTGRAVNAARPYATLTRLRSRSVLRTNAAVALEEVVLRFDVWHDRHDAAQAIANRIHASFDRSGFPLSGGDRVIHMRRTKDAVVQHADGVWQWSLEFLVHLYLIEGV